MSRAAEAFEAIDSRRTKAAVAWQNMWNVALDFGASDSVSWDV